MSCSFKIFIQELEFYTDKEENKSQWSDLKSLRKLEPNQIVKLSKLTDVAFLPKPIKK